MLLEPPRAERSSCGSASAASMGWAGKAHAARVYRSEVAVEPGMVSISIVGRLAFAVRGHEK